MELTKNSCNNCMFCAEKLSPGPMLPGGCVVASTILRLCRRHAPRCTESGTTTLAPLVEPDYWCGEYKPTEEHKERLAEEREKIKEKLTGLAGGGKLETKEQQEKFARLAWSDEFVQACFESSRKEKIDDLIEALAAYAHEAWSGWMEYMLPHLTTRVGDTDVPHAVQDRLSEVQFDPLWHPAAAEKLGRWRRQMDASYALLSEQEKESDRAEARRILDIVQKHALPSVCSELPEAGPKS